MNHRIWKFLVALGGFGIGCCLLGIYTIRTIDLRRTSLTEQNARAIAVAVDLRYLQALEDTWAFRLILSGSAQAKAHLLETRASFTENAKLLKSIDVREATAQTLDDIASLKLALGKNSESTFHDRIAGTSVAKSHRYMDKHVRPIHDRIIRTLDLLIDAEADCLAAERERLGTEVQILKASLGVCFTLMFVGFVAFLVLLKKLESARSRHLEQAQMLAQARKNVLETVAHDLKNPLGAIKMSLELVKEDPDCDVRSIDSLLSISARSADTMSGLVSDLLDHTKIENGQLSIERDHFDFSDMLEAVTQRLKLVAHQKAIQLVSAITPGVWIDGDAKRLEQVVSNLLSNAIKFTPAGGSIHVSAKSMGTCLRVSVADSGPGVGAGDQDHIFDRYWQAPAARPGGTGLGLAISKAIVDAHDGKIWVENRAKGGATFVFEISRADGMSVSIENSTERLYGPF